VSAAPHPSPVLPIVAPLRQSRQHLRDNDICLCVDDNDLYHYGSDKDHYHYDDDNDRCHGGEADMRIASIGDAANVARARRLELGLTQDELAKLVGVSRVWLYTFERGGKLGPELAKVLRLFDALGLELTAAPRTPPAPDAATDPDVVDLDAHLARYGTQR
jgi:DNA-binding XRE family transcriptional regulator